MRTIILFFVIQQLLYYISSVESLIGQNFTPIRGGEFPYIASFQYFPSGRNFCGGALITKKHVITLSSCVEDLSLSIFRIVFEVAHAEEPAVAYTAASYTKYFDWAESRKNRPLYDGYGLAIVTLTDKVYHINPVPLNGLTKRQLDGKAAIMIGWRNDILSKATVNLLSDEDSDRKWRVLLNSTFISSERDLRTSADPFALLDTGDFGSPLLNAHDNSLVGLAFGCIPGDDYVRGNFSTEFIRQHQVNLYYSVYYYRPFIYSVIPAAAGA